MFQLGSLGEPGPMLPGDGEEPLLVSVSVVLDELDRSVVLVLVGALPVRSFG